MYRRSSKRKSPEQAGVAAFNKAISSRLYNERKAQAIIDAIAVAPKLAGSDGQAYGDGTAMQTKAAANRAMYGGVGMYTGRGGFWSDIGDKIGDTFGPGFGDMGKAGRNIGHVFDKLSSGGFLGRGMYTGRGAYTGSAENPHVNSIVDGGGATNSPLFGGDMGTINVIHREYLTDIYGPPVGNSFLVQDYSINPALAASFPFLSQIAANYDEYEFKQLMYTYKSTTTDIGNSTTGQCGTVIQAVNYNADAAPFSDKGSMMEYFGAVSCKVTESSRCGVECDPTQNAGPAILHTRANPVIVGQDLKTYDVGTYQLAIANSPAAYANLPIGELWVDYAVQLRKPKLFTNRGLSIDRDLFIQSSFAPMLSSLSALNWFGPVGNLSYLSAQQNNIGCLILPGVQTQYTGTTSPVQTRSNVSGALSIVIPAAYNGNLRVTVNISGYNLKAYQIPYSSYQSNFLLGNVVQCNDIYAPTSLGNPAIFTGATSGNILTVTGAPVFPFVVGATIIVPGSTTNIPVTIVSFGTGTGGNGTYNLSTTALGTITAVVSNMYWVNSVSPLLFSPGFSIQSGGTTSTSLTAILTVYVKQASAIAYTNTTYSGGDNVISLANVLNDQGVVLGSSVSIEEFQPLGGLKGMTTATDRITFVNNSGVVVVP